MKMDTITEVHSTLRLMQACTETLFTEEKERVKKAMEILEDLLVKEVAR